MKELLQEAAGEIVRVVEGGVRVVPRDDRPGAPDGIHDLDIVLSDKSLIAVEVTMATNRAARELWAAVGQKRWVLPGLRRSWTLTIRQRTRIDALHSAVGRLLAELERFGLDRFNAPEPHEGQVKEVMDELDHLGVRYAKSSAPHGDPLVFVSTVGPGGWVDGSDVCDAVEAEAAKPDNQRKLLAAGGGHLFVWVDNHSADAHAALCGEVVLPLPHPRQFPGITGFWVARYVFGRHPSAGVVLRYDETKGWENVTEVVNRLIKRVRPALP